MSMPAKALAIARFIGSLIVAPVVGEAAAVPIAFFIDIVVGAEVTGGRWPLTIANVIVVCAKALVVGCVAGSITKRLGWLVAALATFMPLEVFVALELIRNRDYSDFLRAYYDTAPSVWVWIGLIPAMVSGHFAAKIAQRGKGLVAQGLGYIFLWAAGVGSFVIHLYTTYVAYQASGLVGAILTFSMPPISEIYLFATIWYSTGTFLNLYTLRLLAWASLILLGALLLGIGALLGNSKPAQQSARGSV
jgi:hypothetical protein